jgi:hypothetical protein
LQASISLKQQVFESYLKHYGILIREEEIEDLSCLVECLSTEDWDIRIFDKFFVSYRIPQIGKEFDLLRFGKNYIINIELKKTSTEDKVKNQLIRNNYYLGFIGPPVYCFSFISESKKLYQLDGDNFLKEVGIEYLLQLLSNQENDEIEDINNLFNPSVYLISPFNSTEKFLRGEYFLTLQQDEVKVKIIDSLNLPGGARFISLTGSAGTGKTLLTFDIAKQIMKSNAKPLIIHCGNLNKGHEVLNENGWEIIPIKTYAKYDISKYDLIIIDEAQRIYPKQLEDIVEKIKSANNACIFSYDKSQTLSNIEEVADASVKISSINSISSYNLSEKIRTNKEIAAFIKMLLNFKRNLPISNKNNIEINYFNSTADAKKYLDSLDGNRWEVLRFTPSTYNREHHSQYSDATKQTSHEVIGQEFEGVAVAIDKNFSYNADGELTYTANSYYKPTKMLFQNITRARKRLNLVIINNEELLNRCASILQ